MTWNWVWTGIISFILANVLPYVVQTLKRILPPAFVRWLKGGAGMYGVWLVSCIVATIQLYAQGKLSPIDWTDPVTATAAILGLGSLISQYAQNLYRAAEPHFKKFLEMLS